MKNLKTTKNLLLAILFGTILINAKAEEERSEKEYHRERNQKNEHKGEHSKDQESVRKNTQFARKKLFLETINLISKKFPIREFFINLKKNNRDIYMIAMEDFSEITREYNEFKSKFGKENADLILRTEFLELYSETIAENYLEKKENDKNIAIPKELKKVLDEIFDNRITLFKAGAEEAIFSDFGSDEDTHDDLDDDNMEDQDESHEGDDDDDDGFNHHEDGILDIDDKEGDENHEDAAELKKYLDKWIQKRIAVKDEVIRRRLEELTNPEKADLYRW